MTENVEPTHSECLPLEASKRSLENEAQVEMAVKRHQGRSFLVPFDREERKQVQQHILADLEMGFDYRRRALAMTLDARLQTIEESCNHVLITGKTYLRQQRSQFFAQELAFLKRRMDEIADAFAINMDQRLSQINKYESEIIKNREKKRLENSVVSFFDTLDQLIDDFSNIVNENVHQ